MVLQVLDERASLGLAALPGIAWRVIPAGKPSISLSIKGVDDRLANGPRQVLVRASATGFASGNAGVIVTDDEAASNRAIAGGVLLSPRLALGVAGVTATLRSGSRVLDVVSSDARGSFRFLGLPPGTYTVSGVGFAFAPAFKSVPLVVPSRGAPSATVSFGALPRAAITGISPGFGTAGSVVAISGLNLHGASSVRFGALAARFSVASGTLIRATVPISASGRVTVVTPQGTAMSEASFFVADPPGG